MLVGSVVVLGTLFGYNCCVQNIPFLRGYYMPIKNLLLRGGIYHVRLALPLDVQPAFGNRVILSKSLRTGDKRLAKELRDQIIGQWKAAIRKERQHRIERGDEWKESLATSAAVRLSALEANFLKQIMTPPQDVTTTSLEALAEAESRVAALREQLSVQVARLEQESLSSGYTGISEDLSQFLSETNEVAKHKASLAISAKVEAFSARKENLLSPLEFNEALDIAKDPASYKPKSPISASGIKAFHEHLSTQHSNQATIKNIISKVTKFSNYLDREGSLLSFDSVAAFLNQFPKASTRKGYIWGLTAYHEWAVLSYIPYRKQFAGLVSPFDKHKFAKAGKGAKENWIPYTRQEAEQLHKAALEKGDIELAHLIQFAAYTGARLEEIGRISKLTTVFEDGLPIAFNVEDSKTAAGIRTVPIHSHLLPLYVQLLEQSEDGYLLKGKLNSGGFRLSIPQGRFSKLKQSLGFSRLHVFHSFRGCVITTLEQAGVSPLAITSLVGHKRNSITFDVYSAGASFEQKKNAIERLHYDF